MSDHSAFVASIPAAYDEGLGPMLFEPYAVDMSERVQRMNGDSILEIAAGTGRVTAHLVARLRATSHLVVSDLNEAMLAVARQRVVGDARVTWQTADAMALPFDDATFDIVVCQFGLMFVPDKAQAIRECYRVLSPHGRLVFSVWGSLDENPIGRIAGESIREHFPVDPPQFYQVPFGLHDPAPIHAWLDQAGFSSVGMDQVDLVGESATADRAAAGLVLGNPVIIAINERGTVSPDTLVQDVAARLEREGGRAPMRLPMRARVFTATK